VVLFIATPDALEYFDTKYVINYDDGIH